MTKFNIDQLETFLAVVRLGGVRKASNALNLTQPAVTARIKNLEDALACDLFERASGRMKLTRRGELLLTHAAKFEDLAQRVEQEIVDPSGIEGRLRLGASETIAQSWLPELISRLHDRYPKLEIEFNVDISINLRAGLMDREIDLAILLGPISDFSVDNIELPEFELAWYASSKAPGDLGKSGFPARPVLTYARNTRPYRELKEQLVDRVGPDVSLFPSTSLSACFRLVEADLGVAALPKMLGAELVADGRIREFDPGWVPSPLVFSASYLGEPRSHLIKTGARLAYEVAVAHLGDKKNL